MPPFSGDRLVNVGGDSTVIVTVAVAVTEPAALVAVSV